jgi:hypothetical protein
MPNSVSRVPKVPGLNDFHQPNFEPIIEGYLPDQSTISNSIKIPSMAATAVKEAQQQPKIVDNSWYQDSLNSVKEALELTVRVLPQAPSTNKKGFQDQDTIESLKGKESANFAATAAESAKEGVEEDEEKIVSQENEGSFRRFLLGSLYQQQFLQPTSVEDKSEALDPATKADLIGFRPTLLLPPQVNAKSLATLDDEMSAVVRPVKGAKDELSIATDQYTPELDLKKLIEITKSPLPKMLENSSSLKLDPTKIKIEDAQLSEYLALLKTQAELKNYGATLHTEDVARRHKHNQELMKEYVKNMDDLAKRDKASEVIKWVNIGITVAVIGFIALTIATGGFAALLGTAVGVVGAIAGVVGGGLTITKGALDYQSNVQKGEIFVIGEERSANSEKIKSLIQDMGQAQREVVDHHSLMKKVLSGMKEATRFR